MIKLKDHFKSLFLYKEKWSGGCISWQDNDYKYFKHVINGKTYIRATTFFTWPENFNINIDLYEISGTLKVGNCTFYLKNSKLHNLEGPAIEDFSDKNKNQYFINGVKYSWSNFLSRVSRYKNGSNFVNKLTIKKIKGIL